MAEGQKKKILLVEDDHLLRSLYSKALSKVGFITMEAMDGYRGLEMMIEERPDLVLLDIMIPVLSGLDFIKKAKVDPRISSIPIVTLTGLAEEEIIKEAFKLGAVGYLIKSQTLPQQAVEEVRHYLEEVAKKAPPSS